MKGGETNGILLYLYLKQKQLVYIGYELLVKYGKAFTLNIFSTIYKVS